MESSFNSAKGLTMDKNKQQPKETVKENYKCRDCGRKINWGEWAVFGVCDPCFDKVIEQPPEES